MSATIIPFKTIDTREAFLGLHRATITRYLANRFTKQDMIQLFINELDIDDLAGIVEDANT